MVQLTWRVGREGWAGIDWAGDHPASADHDRCNPEDTRPHTSVKAIATCLTRAQPMLPNGRVVHMLDGRMLGAMLMVQHMPTHG